MMKRNLLNLDTYQLIAIFKDKFTTVNKLALNSSTAEEFKKQLFNYVYNKSYKYYRKGYSQGNTISQVPVFNAAVRILETLKCSDTELRNGATDEMIHSDPFKWLWEALKGENTNLHPDFMLDMYYLFKQLYLKEYPSYKKEDLKLAMRRWPSGLEDKIFYQRIGSRKYIIEKLVKKIERKSRGNGRYYFDEGLTAEEKIEKVNKWWYDFRFQLVMAIRKADELNYFLNNTLSAETMDVLKKAEEKNIPFFITPYYISLLNVKKYGGYDDTAIRSYVLYSRELVEQFGDIRAWEKEDIVEPGKPNAAGWILPNANNIHRRYPEVAIFIPDSRGRACGGLCALCQRMYGFQKGKLNFDLDKLAPKETWDSKLERLMEYFENDSKLRDILITGGDALMNQNNTLKNILDAIYRMAARKKESNKTRKTGEKYAEIQRVRLGSRLLAYLPSRITDELVEILSEFREKARKVGIKQFVIQTHFESPLEVTVEVRTAVEKLLKAGWLVTNQLVYTVAASRRGHTARLRQILNKIGVITYYTFSVKGFEENYALSVPNCRSVQEQYEEKSVGKLGEEAEADLLEALKTPSKLIRRIQKILLRYNMPFLSTDRNVLNLPGIGKSMTFRTVGLTADGKRILCFSLDKTRKHSPAVNKGEKVYIVENKSIGAYLRQLKDMGENTNHYKSIWYYNQGETEPRFEAYNYPKQEERLTKSYTNIEFV